MINIYDCSDNVTAPPHRDTSMGPRQNDIMADLRYYSERNGFRYVDDWAYADVVITNTTFPPEILASNAVKVKRMDGIYWRKDEVERNEALNAAAVAADLVIFISEYSQIAFHTLYPHLRLKAENVVLNNADDSIYKVNPGEKGKRFRWAANCSNWNRPEKRWKAVKAFAEFVKEKGEELYLIGEPPVDRIPTNVTVCGYQHNHHTVANILSSCDAFVNFSFRDAGCKCVSQAVNCGIPVLYADSGGVPELVGSMGVGVFDRYAPPSFLESVPALVWRDIEKAYIEFNAEFHDFKMSKRRYLEDTIERYFWSIWRLTATK